MSLPTSCKDCRTYTNCPTANRFDEAIALGRAEKKWQRKALYRELSAERNILEVVALCCSEFRYAEMSPNDVVDFLAAPLRSAGTVIKDEKDTP